MASPIVIPISSTKFQLDKTIVAPGGSVTVDIGVDGEHLLEVRYRRVMWDRVKLPHKYRQATARVPRRRAGGDAHHTR